MKRAALLLAAMATVPAAASRSVLVVFAHPDDETVIGSLLARLAAEGHAVHLVTITSGQKGATPHAGIPAGDELGAAREGELRCSCKALGIREPVLLRFQDQGISAPPVMEKIAVLLRRKIDEIRPEVVITWGPDGLTGHPDHRSASCITTQVFQQRGLLRHHPRKLYYVAAPESRLLKPAPPFDRRPLRTLSDVFVTTEIDCRRFHQRLYSAMQCHKTQWTEEQLRQVYAMQTGALGGRVFLRLALSDPPHAGARETDLFSGLQ